MTDPPAIHTAANQRIVLRAVALALLTFLSYLPAIQGGFIWDDDAHVTQNAALTHPDGLRLIWLTPGATPQYYPLTHTSFWIERRLWGLNPTGYHLVNVLLHIANALLLWRILAMLSLPGAWLAAMIFAVHPVHVESVAWISERKNVLSGFFYLLAALWFFMGTRRWGWYVASLLAFGCAILSKTVTGSLPAALILVLFWKQRKLTRGQIVMLVPMFAVAVVMAQVTSSMERWNVGATGREWDFTFAQRLLIAGRALWMYACKLVAPIRLNFFYPKWDVDPSHVLPWLFPAGVLAVVVILLLARRRLGAGPLVAVLFFAGTVFPALGFVNVYPMRFSYFADHFQYLASIGLIALLAAALARWMRYVRFVPLLLAALAFQRAHVFADARRLWEDTLAKNTDAAIAHNHLATLAADRGDIEQALGHYDRAIELEPDSIEGYMGLGNLLMRLGDTSGAIEQFRKAIAVKPAHPWPHYVLGVALIQSQDLSGAIASFEASLAADPRFVSSHLRLAEVYQRLGQSDKADEQKRIAQRKLQEAFGYDVPPIAGSLRNE